MNKLPLNFPEWIWTGSNGGATAVQTIRAMQALQFKEKTEQFNYRVWIDLVTLLGDALAAAGLTWDDKYLSYEQTKYAIYHSALTAAMFNSVCHNAAVFINGNWKWSFDPTFDGYIGRTEVIGASTSDTPDTVYGSYILELARKINLLIWVLKDVADFSELGYNSIITAGISSNAVSRPAAPLDSRLVDRMYIYEATLGVRDKKILTADNLIHGQSVSELEIIEPPESMFAKTEAKAIIDAMLEFFNFYSQLLARVQVSENIVSNLAVNNLKGLLISRISAYSIAGASMVYNAPVPLSSHLSTLTASTANAALRPPVILSEAHTSIHGTIDTLRAALLQPKHLLANVDMFSGIPARKLIAIQPVYAPNTVISATADFQSQLSRILPVSIFGSANSNAAIIADAETIHNVVNLIVNTVSTSNSSAQVSYTQPLNMSATATGKSATQSSIELKAGKSFISNTSARARISADLATISMKNLNAAIHARATFSALLDYGDGDWLSPIQNNTNLYIRQALLAYEYRKSLNIDVWKNSKKTDSNLYIPQSYECTNENTNIAIT